MANEKKERADGQVDSAKNRERGMPDCPHCPPGESIVCNGHISGTYHCTKCDSDFE